MESIQDRIAESYPDVLFMNGYDNCVVGIVRRCKMKDVVLYDQDAVINNLMNDGMSEEEAVEYFEFNQIGGWNGDYTPCFMNFAPIDGKCIVGRVYRYGMDAVTLYDQSAVINKMVNAGMTEFKAKKLFKSKRLGVWKGKRTPCFMDFILPGPDGSLSVVMEKEIRLKRKMKKDVVINKS